MYIGNTVITQGFVPQIDYFNGNGSTTSFTLSRPVASVAQLLVHVANVTQNPSSAFTVTGNTITFASAPPSGTNNIWVEYTSLITQVIAPSPGTVGTSQLQNNSVGTSQIANGSVGTTQLANLTALPTSGGNITLPAVSGTAMVSGNMPAFRAYQNSTQSVSNGVITKVKFDAKTFDTATCFDATTNYRFTPNVSGYYQINTNITFGTGSASGYVGAYIYKNGSVYSQMFLPDSVQGVTCFLGDIIYFNGSTDYIETYWIQNSGLSQNLQTGSNYTYFSGSMVRSA